MHQVERPRSFRTFAAICVATAGALALLHTDRALAQSASASGLSGPAARAAPLVAGLTAEQLEILRHMSIVHLDDGQGGLVKTIRFTGVNVQIVNGLDATNAYPADPTTKDPAFTATNGVGNLIVGYAEPGNGWGDDRTGSHNAVVGTRNSYSGFGGLVVGSENTTAGAYATVSAGGGNRALSELATVSGGINNTADGVDATVSGGFSNTASGFVASVSGGSQNVASGEFSSVAGGTANAASGSQSVVSGGGFNLAAGFVSTVGGGSSRSVTQSFNWAAGSLFESF